MTPHNGTKPEGSGSLAVINYMIGLATVLFCLMSYFVLQVFGKVRKRVFCTICTIYPFQIFYNVFAIYLKQYMKVFILNN